MAGTFSLSVVAPDRSVVETTALSLVAPGIDGYFGVQAGHVALVSALRPGLLEFIDDKNNRQYVYVGGGFVEVAKGKVTVLADEARLADEVLLAEAEKALEEARKALRGEASTIAQEDAVMEIERATARIRAARSTR